MTDRDVRMRVETVERSLRHTRVALAAMALLNAGLVLTAMRPSDDTPPSSAQAQDVIRTRGVIVVDSAGTPRIVIGQAPGQRRSPQHGIMINDVKVHERFGVGIADDGLMGMGFDAPVGVGDQRNRERMYLAVGPSGLASFHVMDNTTRVKARLSTDRNNQAWLEFLDWGVKGVDSVMVIGLPQARRIGQKASNR